MLKRECAEYIEKKLLIYDQLIKSPHGLNNTV
jgi:hypothetical protein